MYLIKICPSCKTKLRFPIDKGTIKITCVCGQNFIINPDDTNIYKDASFDLSHSTCLLKKMSPLKHAFARFKFKHIIPFVINKTLNIKYKILNFKLLPDTEKRKIILTVLTIIAGLACVVITIYLLAIKGSNERIIV